MKQIRNFNIFFKLHANLRYKLYNTLTFFIKIEIKTNQ